ncbi:MAG TPA: acyloxyacyl hydrolase [Gemmatimonadaceae bacterium]|nr:acyloxyacyl hydrolase [Gemmatimonadaceae bacterium]
MFLRSHLAALLAGLVMLAGRAGAQYVPGTDSSARRSAPAHGAMHARAPTPEEAGRPFFEFWAGGTHHSAFSTRLGTRYRDLFLAGMRVGWAITTGPHVSLDYVVDAIPVAVMSGNPEYRFVNDYRPCRPGEACSVRLVVHTIGSYHTVYGFGLAPLGVRLQLFRQSPVRLLLHVNGGVLWFQHPVPDPKATQFNFTAEAGGAVQWWVTRHDAVVAGYELHHTSNAATGEVNPGMNSGVFSLGLTRWRE